MPLNSLTTDSHLAVTRFGHNPVMPPKSVVGSRRLQQPGHHTVHRECPWLVATAQGLKKQIFMVRLSIAKRCELPVCRNPSSIRPSVMSCDYGIHKNGAQFRCGQWQPRDVQETSDPNEWLTTTKGPDSKPWRSLSSMVPSFSPPSYLFRGGRKLAVIQWQRQLSSLSGIA